MATTLAEVLQHFGESYLHAHALSTAQARAWRAVVGCRTAAMGGQVQRCTRCGVEQMQWYSCRSRYCPRCQARAQDDWRRARLAELLDVPYCHLVFTLPHALNALAHFHAAWVYKTLLACVAATLNDFAANPRWLGAQPAFTLVLHTWTQDLRLHIHAHALMVCGGLNREGHWCTPTRGERFLFPVHALSRVFAGKFMAALHSAERQGQLPRDPQRDASARRQRRQALSKHAWVVYAKTPLAGAAAVLDYLARYTHRTALSPERIVGIDAHAVRLRVRRNAKDEQPAGKRCVVIPGEQFIARVLQHVLPPGFKRIRHYGLLAAAHKKQCLALARSALNMCAPTPKAMEEANAFMQRVAQLDIALCPHCRLGRWEAIRRVEPVASAGPWAGRRHSDACAQGP